jgi:hypothetical protein
LPLGFGLLCFLLLLQFQYFFRSEGVFAVDFSLKFIVEDGLVASPVIGSLEVNYAKTCEFRILLA